MSNLEPELESSDPVWDLVAEFLERQENGEPLRVEEFVQQYPKLADKLRECLTDFEWMEQKSRPTEVEEPEFPHAFGHYTLLRVIGRGGMGTVYEAIHRPLRRHVAVKVLPPHLTHIKEFRIRFLREARVVASLHHTNIAPVFEVGQVDSSYYMAMPFIDGPNLRELLLLSPDIGPRSYHPKPYTRSYFRWVAEVGACLAEALEHAHRHGIVHRDVKPSNVLTDRDGDIWLADFGLAKARQHPAVTQPGELVGTLRYASPEQIRNEPIDVRSDIYSLGVTLFELLTRQHAFPDESNVRLAQSRPERPRSLVPQVPVDLETIVLRAMEPRPSDRYRSAREFADDLHRFKANEPIRARRIGVVGRLTRWCRRNPSLSLVTSLSVVLLLSLAVFDHYRLVRQLEVTARQTSIAQERNAELLSEKAARLIVSNQPAKVSQSFELIKDASSIRFRPDLWELASDAIQQFDVRSILALRSGIESFDDVAISPDGKYQIGLRSDDRIALWDKDGNELRVVERARLKWRKIGWLNNDFWYGSTDQEMLIAHRATSEVKRIPLNGRSASPAPNGQWLALLGDSFAVWDSKLETTLFDGEPALASGEYGLAIWNSLSTLVAVSDMDGNWIQVWRVPEGDLVASIDVHAETNGLSIRTISFLDDAGALLVGCSDGSLRHFDLWAPDKHRVWGRLNGPVLATSASQATTLAADERSLWLWHSEYGRLIGRIRHNGGAITRLSSSQTQDIAVLVDDSGNAWRYDFGGMRIWRAWPAAAGRVRAMQASLSGREVVWGASKNLTLHSVLSGVSRTVSIPTEAHHLSFSQGGNKLAIAGSAEHPVAIMGVNDLRDSSLGRAGPNVTAMAFIAPGDRLAVASSDQDLVIWKVGNREEYARIQVPIMTTLAGDSSGQWLVGGTGNGELVLINLGTLRLQRTQVHRTAVVKVAIDPARKLIVSAGEDGTICGWSLPGLHRKFVLENASTDIVDLAFVLDGRLLASCHSGGTVRLWSLDREISVARLHSHVSMQLESLVAISDGRWLLATGPASRASQDRAAFELWDVATLHEEIIRLGLPSWFEE